MKINFINWNKFQIQNQQEKIDFVFYIDNEQVNTNYEGDGIYSFNYVNELLGCKSYVIYNNEEIVVSNELLPMLDDFDDLYFYDGELGSKYFKDHTEFKLWAPLAHKVILNIDNNHYELQRDLKGVFSLTLSGNFDGSLYDYTIYRDDLEITSIDPYGKSSNANGLKSAVINFEKTKINLNSDKLPKFNNYINAIIYEGHVRDLTISSKTNIKNKGKFVGLTEKDAKTVKNNPFGLSYLKDLGITHLQLLPVLDYGSVNELEGGEYNWGYDPIQFFTLDLIQMIRTQEFKNSRNSFLQCMKMALE